MSIDQLTANAHEVKAIIGEPEVVEDTAVNGVPVDVTAAHGVEHDPAWGRLKGATARIQALQADDGRLAREQDRAEAGELVEVMVTAIEALRSRFAHDDAYLRGVCADLRRWASEGFEVPDFHDSLVAFSPQTSRVDGLCHLVVFPMYTQNGSNRRLFEAVLVEVIWPEFVAAVEREYANPLFVPLRFIDFTAGYDTNSAVLFPETVAMREIPAFTWGAIFQDREAARFRRVVRRAAEVTKLDLPASVERLLGDQGECERAFVMWDLIHDRSHMRGDLPFDPFMIKQRMPYFLYSLEELRCDLTAYRECVGIEKRLGARLATGEELAADEREMLTQARNVQVAVLLDRIFRFALTGSRVRNYDGLGGQLLFAWLHRRGALHWTDTRLEIAWEQLPDAVLALGDAVDDLYWRSIDRPKVAHWLAAYDLVRSVLEPHPASRWAKGLPDEILAGAPKGYTDAVLDDEFPLSMFYEALERKMRPVIESTCGITAHDE